MNQELLKKVLADNPSLNLSNLTQVESLLTELRKFGISQNQYGIIARGGEPRPIATTQMLQSKNR